MFVIKLIPYLYYYVIQKELRLIIGLSGEETKILSDGLIPLKSFQNLIRIYESIHQEAGDELLKEIFVSIDTQNKGFINIDDVKEVIHYYTYFLTVECFDVL